MSETYYVTTPIYYVNDEPHIGHSYTTIAADVLSRFYRAAGRDVRFGTGTDEHGVKIVQAAEEKGKTPRQLADEVVVHFQNLWGRLGITNDDFIRTTEDRHEKRVQKLVQEMLDRGEIYLGKYEGWYDEGQEQYVTESAARDNDFKSPINGRALVRYSEENWFFRLGKWAAKLIGHIEANAGFIRPAARRNEVLSKLKLGLESGELGDLCISRNKAKLPWGVEMPNDPTHVVYVWIDALSNYYTALGLPEIGDAHDGEAKRYWPCDVHLIGKDILWFHTVYWPCMLLSLDIPLPKCIFAHGWWTSEGRKMSKSLGNCISLASIAELCDEYSCDVFRYYVLRAVTFGSDGDFSRDMFKRTYNSDLANGLGNLLSRTVKMIDKYFAGEVPALADEVPQAAAVRSAGEKLHASAEAFMDECAFHKYIDAVMNLLRATNLFIDQTEPFKLAGDESARGRLATILYTCAEATRLVLLYFRPIMPDKADAGLAMLGLAPPDGLLGEDGQWGGLQPATKVQKSQPLFPRKQ